MQCSAVIIELRYLRILYVFSISAAVAVHYVCLLVLYAHAGAGFDETRLKIIIIDMQIRKIYYYESKSSISHLQSESG